MHSIEYRFLWGIRQKLAKISSATILLSSCEKENALISTSLKQGLIVTGMHRSGTSCVAGMLEKAGFEFGDSLIPAKAGVNEKGFFEDRNILEINQQLLVSLQREWWSFDPIDPEDWLSDSVAEIRATAIAFMSKRFNAAESWVFKDPRFCLLMPFWLDVFRALGVELKFLISVRHPDAVAQSLNVRDDFDASLGHLLWVQHYLAVEKFTRGMNRFFIDYDKLVCLDNTELDRLKAFVLSSDLNLDFVEPELQHFMKGETVEGSSLVEQGGFNSISQASCEIESQLYSAMNGLSQGSNENESILVNAFDSAQANYAGNDLSHRYAMRRQRLDLFKLNQSYQSAETILLDQEKQFVFQQEGFQSAVDQLKSAHTSIAAQAVEMKRLEFLLNESMNGANSNSISSSNDPSDGKSNGLKLVEKNPKPRKYESRIDPLVVNNAHSRVIRQVLALPTTHPILEVGCSSGYLGAFLKTQGFTVWGIEPDVEAAEVASECLDYVFNGTIESFFDMLGDSPGTVKFGAILFGDVLEHLADPLAILLKAIETLSDAGQIIVSIPNVAHISVRMMLLEGRWEYEQTGILDETHLRFFTRDSIVDLMDSAGLKVLDFESVEQTWQESSIGINTKLHDQVANLLDDSEQNVFQYIVTTTPMCNPCEPNRAFRVRNRRKVLCLLPLPDSSLANIRILEPLRKNAEKYGSTIRTNSVYKPTVADIAWCEVVVFQRESSDYMLGLMSNLRLLGKKIIFDIDDLLLRVPEYLTVHDHCTRMRPFLENALATADAVTVSTQPLFESVVPFNTNTHLVPNGAFSQFPPISHHETPANVCTLIVASSDSVRVDFVVDALKTLVSVWGENLKLVGIGPPATYLYQQGLPIEVHPIMAHDHFRAFLAAQENALAWIPLDESEFNRCKSAVKYFDYSLAGIPVLCSRVLPYSDAVIHGETGYLCGESQGEWIEHTEALMGSSALRKSIANVARIKVIDGHNIERTAAAWQLAIESLKFPNAAAPEIVNNSNLIECEQAMFRGSLTTTVSPITLFRSLFTKVNRPSAYMGALRIYRLYGMRGIWNYLNSSV